MTAITIIGGGAIGLLSARELALAGASVTLLETGDLAQESSWAGGGIISPLYPWRYLDSVTHLARWSQQQYPELSDSLIETTSIDPELLSSGLLIHAPDEQQQALQWAQKFGYNIEIVDEQKIQTIEPGRKNPPQPMLWMPEVRQVRNPRLARALVADAQRLGVEIVTQCSVNEFHTNAGKVTALNTSQGMLTVDQVLTCAGAWTGQLLQDLAPPPDIHPVRGQMILFRGKPGVLSRIVLEENRYIIPRKDGRILFGSTIEEANFDKSTTDEAREELVEIATSRFPILKQFEIEKHWAGLRPGSPAGVPYIAQHPAFENLYVNAGHYRNGLVLGPASARLASDLILQRNPIVDPAPYSLTAGRG
ncbi:MAG: glycine oxidase ThiO [bacterium]